MEDKAKVQVVNPENKRYNEKGFVVASFGRTNLVKFPSGDVEKFKSDELKELL